MGCDGCDCHGRSITGITNPDATTKQFAYNGTDQTTGFTDARGNVTHWAYDLEGRLTTKTYADTSTLTTAYDALGRVASRTVAGSGPETFQYDAIGRLVTHGSDLGSFALAYLGQTSQITSRALSGFTLATTWSYLPNSGDRRLSGIANAGLASGQYTNFTITTNVINQITGLTQSSDATAATPTAASQTATFNALNQISSLNSQSVTYDANGNLTADGTRSYTWDAENRLIGVATTGSSGQSLSFSYDGFGRRTTIATTPSGGSTVTSAYLWCGLSLCQARDATGSVTREYLDEGEYLAGSSPKSLYYGLDQIGSVRRVFSSDGTAPAYDYDPYGNPLQSTAPITDFGYASLFNAGTSGLNLATFRAYDPATGRWISRDPIGERGDSSGNLYGYVGQNPTNYRDKSGLQSEDERELVRSPDEIREEEEELVNPRYRGGLEYPRPPEQSPKVCTEFSDPPFDIPRNYTPSPSKKGGGITYRDPSNPHNSVRIMPGNPNSPNPAQQNPYVKDMRSGVATDGNGNPVDPSSPEAHIPQTEYRYRP